MSKQYTGKKRLIQSLLYHKCKENSNVIALAGNNLDLHLEDIRHIIGNKKTAYVYDIDEMVVNNFKYLESNQIKIINSDILNCRIERFMDIDLMQTLQTIEGLIYYIFNKQYRKFYKNSYRLDATVTNTFMFTFALRRNKRDVNKFINCLLEDKKLNIVHKEIISYRDGCPMCTVQIQYNFINI